MDPWLDSFARRHLFAAIYTLLVSSVFSVSGDQRRALNKRLQTDSWKLGHGIWNAKSEYKSNMDVMIGSLIP